MEESMFQIFKMQANICKTLADPNRLMLLHELREGEKSVGEMVSRSHLSQSNVSRHLAVLRERGLVVTRREGTTIYYNLASPKIGEACDMVRQVLVGHLMQNQELASSLTSVK